MVLILSRSKRLIVGDVIASDTEGTGLSPWKGDRPWAFSFCNADGDTKYLEFPVCRRTRRVLYDRYPKQKRMLVDFYTDPRVEKVFWNAKYDVRMIRFGLEVEVQGTIHEGMFAAHACNPSELTYALKPWTKKYAGYDDSDQDELQKATVNLRRRAKAKGWKLAADVEGDYWLCMYAYELYPDDKDYARYCRGLAEKYARQDSERTMLAWMFCEGKMEELGVRPVYDEEMQLWPAVMEMEDRGVNLNKPIVAEQINAYDEQRRYFLGRLMEVGEEARKCGALDTAGVGVVTQVDRYKRGGLKRLRVLLADHNGQFDPSGKDKWFKAEHCGKDGGLDDVAAGDYVRVHEPFKQPEFNPGSDDQLAKLLYDYLGLSVPENLYRKKKKKSASRPVDADTLLELSASTELVDDILSWRAAEKALDLLGAYDLGTEYDRLSQCHVLHADFQQCGPKSGRFSCKRPNLQQSASRSGGRAAKPIDTRAPFGPRPGHVWYCIDYSQLEVRIFADLSQETKLCEIIRSGKHVHKACADHVWGYRDGKPTDACIRNAIQVMGYNYAGTQIDTVPQQELRKRFDGMSEERAAELWLDEFEGSIVTAEESIERENTKNKGKLAIFTKLFGGGIPSIMNLMKCTRDEAATFIREYDEGFPEMAPWMKKVAAKGRRDGCCWTAFGRRIVLDDPDKSYRCVNYIVQGSAADLMKRGMRACHEYIKENGLKAWIIMTIHDELVFEFDRAVPRMEHVMNLKQIMEDHSGVFGLPMETKVSVVRKRWSEKEEVSWAKHIAL